MEVTAQRITPFLWFDGRAEEAAAFYVSLFPNSKITERTHYGDHGPGEKGEIMTVAFTLAGQQFTALNGGPHYTFTPAVSFAVGCDTQEEIDRLWDALTGEKCAELPVHIPVTIISASNSTAAQLAERETITRRSLNGQHLIATKNSMKARRCDRCETSEFARRPR